MDELVIYILLMVGATLFFFSAAQIQTTPTRRCPGCEDEIDVRAAKCRGCGYRFR